MPEHIRAVAGHLHLPLLEKMLQESDYPDKTLIQDFRRGFPVMGRLPGSGVYPAEDPLPEPELDQRAFWRKAAAEWATLSPGNALETTSSSSERSTWKKSRMAASGKHSTRETLRHAPLRQE